MRIEEDIKLDFTDVLIKPKRSTLGSRNEVDLEREMTFLHSKRRWKHIPIMTANMDTTGTFEMYESLSKHGLMTCLSKHYEAAEYPLGMDKDLFMVTTGITEKDYHRLRQVINRVEPYFVCIDVANGYSSKFGDFTRKIREEFPGMTLMGGNVATPEMTTELIINGGLDVVSIGIGSGSQCHTRSKAAIGVPQLSAIIECADAAHGVNAHIISDGGLTQVGDFSISFGAGADFIKSGSFFAGHTESAGNLVEKDGKQFKEYYGMSSKKAMDKHHGGMAKYRSSEGAYSLIPYKGPVEDTVLDILGGIRSCMTYIGARKLKDIPKCTTFIRVNRRKNDSMNQYKL